MDQLKDSGYRIGKKTVWLIGLSFLIFAAGTVFSIVKLNAKINTLYIAARDLEATVHEQIKAYDLRADGDGEIVGLAFRLSDGRLILVNGGDEGNVSYLKEWIGSHGALVHTWYITDQKLAGACRSLMKEKGSKIVIEEVIEQKGWTE